MTVIGRSTHWLHMMAASKMRGGHWSAPRMEVLLQSLTNSLDLACRGYLCAPLVDCDPLMDPECGPTGKKLQFPEPVRQGIVAATGDSQMPAAEARVDSDMLASLGYGLGSGRESVSNSRLKESVDENLPGK
jgi:hypothetical protein